MRVFVFAYNRYDTMTTSRLLEADGVDHTVLCHTEDDLCMFAGAGTAKLDRLYATGNPKGLAFQFNAALELMDEGEWALFLVDDLKSVTELRNYDTAVDPLPMTTANQSTYRERFKHPVPMQWFLHRAEHVVWQCTGKGSYLGGWTSNNNPLFRKGHWGRNVLIDGRAWVIRKSHLRFDTNVHIVSDYAFCAENIRTFGSIWQDRWLLPDFDRYGKGGYGTVAERLPQKMQECAYLVEKYPELIAYANKAGQPMGSHIRLRQTKGS